MSKKHKSFERIKRKADQIARRVFGEHPVPVFEASASRHHRRVSLLELRLRTVRRRVVSRQSFSGVQSFLQFAGFPRSGHSLIGSLIDAHPRGIVAHELDILGLIDAGWSRRDIFSLIESESAAFMKHGRYWNGFAYVVPGQFNGRAAAPIIMGDKKGDWAVRRMQRDPGLLERLHETIDMPCKWLLVVRNPFDNIATMSLRRGGTYDRLRISSPDSETFRARLKAETGKSIADKADDNMIEDFVGLCHGVAAMQSRVAPEHWLGVGYESFAEAPVEGLGRILDFLDLSDQGGFVADAASIVRAGGSRSRHSVIWSQAQIDRVREAIAEFEFLSLAETGEP